MKSSFIKISMLLGATGFLVAGSAIAKTQAENGVFDILSQDELEQLGGVVEQMESAQRTETFEQAAPVEQVESDEISNETSVDETSVADEEVVSVNEVSASDEEVVAVNEISVEVSVVSTQSEEGSNVVVSEVKSEDEGDGFETASSMSTEDLDESRGAFSPTSTSYLMGTSSNNTVNNSVTGGNVISEGAFNSNSGLVNVIQNSGNNVLIQSSTIVNVEMNQ
ncbi:MAG: hypothetical protein AABY33_07520 [Pseudomonadota bacterium]